MAGRPQRTSSTPNTGRLWSILAGLGGSDNGVTMNDPAQDDKDLVDMLGDNASTENDSNTLSARPTATPTHWWNKGRANDINNQLIMQDYGRNQDTANAIKQTLAIKSGSIPLDLQSQQTLMPGRLNEANQLGQIENKNRLSFDSASIPLAVDKARQLGQISTEQALRLREGLIPLDAQAVTATGNAQTGVDVNRANLLRPSRRQDLNDTLTHSSGLPVSDETNASFANVLTEPRLAELLQKSNTGTTSDMVQQEDLNRGNQLKAAQFPLTLADVPQAFKDKQAMEDAKLLQTQNEATRAKYLSSLPGAEIFDTSKAGAPAVYSNPLKPVSAQEQMMQDFLNRRRANQITPANSARPTAPVMGALPKSIPQATPQNNAPDYAQDKFNVTDPVTGKKGSIIGGVFVPYKNQPSAPQ